MTVVFMDRDGVINENRDDYVKSVGEFVFLSGALESLARLHQAGIPVVVISNQAGVGRGLIASDELERINECMLSAIRESGGDVCGLYYCLHRKDESCDCRKPEIGLLRKACAEHDLSVERSYFVGDGESDMEAGRRAGCVTILVLSGRSSAEQAATWQAKPDLIVPDLAAAVDHILACEAR